MVRELRRQIGAEANFAASQMQHMLQAQGIAEEAGQ